MGLPEDSKGSQTRKRLMPRLTGSRKKQKRSEIYNDPGAVLGSWSSPLFEDNVNIKV